MKTRADHAVNRGVGGAKAVHVAMHLDQYLIPIARSDILGCRVAQLLKCLATSGYPDGSRSGGPGFKSR